MKKIIIFICLIISINLSTSAIAARYSTYILVNKHEQGSMGDIYIDYTICNDYLEKNPSCTSHKNELISPEYPFKVDLNSESDVVYIWKSSTYVYGGQRIAADYSRKVINEDKKQILISNCLSTNGTMVIMDTYQTRKLIGCHSVIIGNEG